MTGRRFAPKPAIRTGQKARVALAGPSGSGKTWTGLESARILAAGEPVLAIDSERGSASLYADYFQFDVVEWEPPFDPRELADLIADQATKYAVILIDSLSHFWEGEGGTRDIVDAAAARARGNSFAGWKEGTPAQNDMVAAILQAPCHVIATMRSKTEYVLETDSRGKQVPKKVGMAPIQRAGIEYEFTVTADLDVEHTLLVDKTRCHALSGRMFKMGHTGEMASILSDWLGSAEPATPVDAPGVVVGDWDAAAEQQHAERSERPVPAPEMAAWAQSLTVDRLARWEAWKAAHDGWHHTDTAMAEAYIVLRDLSAEEAALAGTEPFDVTAAGDDVVDAELVPPADDGPSPLVNRGMVTRLQVACGVMGLNGRTERLHWAAGVLGRDVGSFNDLTVAEADRLINAAALAASKAPVESSEQ